MLIRNKLFRSCVNIMLSASAGDLSLRVPQGVSAHAGPVHRKDGFKYYPLFVEEWYDSARQLGVAFVFLSTHTFVVGWSVYSKGKIGRCQLRAAVLPQAPIDHLITSALRAKQKTLPRTTVA